MYRVEISETAMSDLRELYVWIAIDKDSPKTATKYVQDIYDEIKKLYHFPTAFPFDKNKSVVEKYGMNVRRINYKKMAILYTHNEETSLVYIYRIIAQSMITGL